MHSQYLFKKQLLFVASIELLLVKLFNPKYVVKSIKNFIRIALEFEYDIPQKDSLVKAVQD